MQISAYTYYERKAFQRLGGLLKCLGLTLLHTTWDGTTRTAKLTISADEEGCYKFIAAASKRVRQAEYSYVDGLVWIKFTSRAQSQHIPLERRTAVGVR